MPTTRKSAAGRDLRRGSASLLLAGGVLVAAFVPAGPAHAASVVAHEATFSVSLSGTWTSNGTVVRDDCIDGVTEDGDVIYVTRTASAGQTATFRTPKTTNITVTKRRGAPVESYLSHGGKPLRVTGTYTRTSTVGGSGTGPRGCRGGEDDDRAPDCGTRTLTHRFGFGAENTPRGRWKGLAFGLHRTGPLRPDFDNCRLVPDQPEIPFSTRTPIIAKVAVSRLTDRGVRKIRLRGTVPHTVSTRTVKASGQLRWTLTLTRRKTVLTECGPGIPGACRYRRLEP